jgi:hypothetical protein
MLPGPTYYEFLRLQQATSAHVEHRARYICCVICLVSDTGNAGTGPYSMQKRITQGKTSRLPWRYQAQLAGALGEQEHQASGWRVRTGCNTPESRTPRWGQLLDSQARLHLQFCCRPGPGRVYVPPKNRGPALQQTHVCGFAHDLMQNSTDPSVMLA